MDKHLPKKTPEQMVEAVFALDLDPIKFKLMDANEGYGWTRAEADRHETEYKRFLALVAKFPAEAIVPNKEVDKFWHGHILDTMKYAEDCENVFGYFLHHFPYFGMRDAEDAANLATASERTQSLYRQEFGSAKQPDAAYCGVAAASYCGAAAEQGAAAYCGVASDKPNAAYCGVASGKAEAAYCGAANASYCGVVTGKGRPALDKSAAYCGVAAAGEAGQPAYCGATNASYCGVVTAKGRPVLEEAV